MADQQPQEQIKLGDKVRVRETKFFYGDMNVVHHLAGEEGTVIKVSEWGGELVAHVVNMEKRFTVAVDVRDLEVIGDE
jgi:hypothetical protein